MKLFTISVLLGISIPLAIFAQEKKAPATKAPAKPQTGNPPVAVAKPVAEPVEEPVAEPEGPPEPAKPAPAPDPQAQGESGTTTPPHPPAEIPPEPAPVEEVPKPAPDAEPADPPGTRVTLVDGTRRVALPLQQPGQAPVAGKQGLPTVTSPYPPKALAPLPAGWKLQLDPTVAPLPHQVKLADGRMLELEVIPPCLVPDNLGKSILFHIERGDNSPESTLSAARKAHAESRAKVQELLRKLDSSIPPPPSPAPPTP